MTVVTIRSYSGDALRQIEDHYSDAIRIDHAIVLANLLFPNSARVVIYAGNMTRPGQTLRLAERRRPTDPWLTYKHNIDRVFPKDKHHGKTF